MKEVYKRMWHYRLQTLIAVVSLLCNVLAVMALPSYMAKIINQGVTKGDLGFIIRTGLVMGAITLGGGVMMIISSYHSAQVAMKIGRDLRSAMFRKVEGFSLAEFDRFGTASLITRTTNDITQVENFVLMLLRMVLMSPLMLISGIVMAYRSSPALSGVLVVAIPLLVAVIGLMAFFALPLSKKMQTLVDNVNMVLREKLTGIRVIRAFGTESYEEQRFAKANTDLTEAALRLNRLASLMMPGLMLVLNFAIVALVWQGGDVVASGNLLVGDVMAMIQYITQIMLSFMMMSLVFVMYPRAAASAQRLTEVLDTPNSVTDPDTPVQAVNGTGVLEFQNVSFAYNNAPNPALEDISFTALPGTTTAIIGSTGSGKTTIINLILRFYDTTKGRILLDGIDLRELSQSQLRSKIGYVPQKAVLFRGSIADNIRHGRKQADDGQLELATEIAQAQDFVQERPEGYAAPVAQGGTNLSGGQRQRLSIARAIVRRPALYLFDDSFSALDYKTDARLRAALQKHTKQSTVLIVAQRVSTIMNADTIIVLEKGRIAGMGTHQSLLQSCPIYREIAVSQLSDKEVGL